jgi:uncharacterized membrane protein
MDAETRHHLKENELAALLSKLRQSDQTTIFLALAVIVLIVLLIGVNAYRGSVQAAEAEAWSAMFALNPLNAETGGAALTELQSIAEQHDGVLGAVAAMRAASTRTYEVQMGDVEDPAAALEEASAMLTPVLRRVETLPSAVAGPAHMLAAQIAEGQRDLETARGHYDALLAPRFAGNPLQAIANQRLQDLDALSSPVALAAGAPPQPQGTNLPPGMSPSLIGPLQNRQISPPTTPPATNEDAAPAEAAGDAADAEARAEPAGDGETDGVAEAEAPAAETEPTDASP